MELVINLVMVDKNNQIYELSEKILSTESLPLLQIPKMDKITSKPIDKYLLTFSDYKHRPYISLINSFGDLGIYDQGSIFK